MYKFILTQVTIIFLSRLKNLLNILFKNLKITFSNLNMPPLIRSIEDKNAPRSYLSNEINTYVKIKQRKKNKIYLCII